MKETRKIPPAAIGKYENCGDLIEKLLKMKKSFHKLGENIHGSYSNLLNAPLLGGKQQSWNALKEEIENCQQERETLAADIAKYELAIKQKLSNANLALGAILTKKQAMLEDLKALKDEVSHLHSDMMNKTKFYWSSFTYPTYTKNIGLNWRMKNKQELECIGEKLDSDKKADREKNLTIEKQYQKIVSAAHKVIASTEIQSTQSFRTVIVNIIGMLTVIGIMAGIYNKVRGGDFFLWNKNRKPIVDLHKGAGDLTPEPADILGIPKSK
ncbi:MAG: hypothetical protein ACNA7Y_03420 [Gammaproteobacteria bacterium]